MDIAAGLKFLNVQKARHGRRFREIRIDWLKITHSIPLSYFLRGARTMVVPSIPHSKRSRAEQLKMKHALQG